MSAEQIPSRLRIADYISHIDMEFLNRRLTISALGPVRDIFIGRQTPGADPMAQLRNDKPRQPPSVRLRAEQLPGMAAQSGC